MSSSSRKMLQAAAGSAGGGEFYGYTIDNSARFNNGDSPYLSKTFSSARATNVWTFSCWFKRSLISSSAWTPIFEAYHPISVNPNSDSIGIYQDKLLINYISGTADLTIPDLFRDSSAWYHLVVSWDVNETGLTDTLKIWVNGVRKTSYSSVFGTLVSDSLVFNFGSNVLNRIGSRASGTAQYFDGYLSQVAFVDGTAYSATDFGEDKNGVWIPKNITGLTYGTNGFYLAFQDSSNLGDDTSGNTNDWTVSGLTSSDQMIDTPTNNFCTFNPLAVSNTTVTLSEGNLKVTTPLTGGGNATGTIAIPSSGKWYFEITGNNVDRMMLGLWGYDVSEDYAWQSSVPSILYYYDGNKYVDSSYSAYGSSYTTNDVIGVAIDVDGGTVTFYKNNTSQGAISYDASGLFPCLSDASGSTPGDTGTADFGQSGFTYTPPADHLALCTANLPEPTIGPNSTTTSDENFNTVLYTGNGTAIGSGGKALTGVGFQPDFTWIKNRDAADNHMLFDAVRGVTKYLSSNNINAEATDTESLSTFDTDGFTLGNNVAVNTNAENYVAWNWKGNSSGSSNTDGSITSTVSANTDAGISIVTWTGNAINGATVGHGLGKTPNFIIGRRRDVGDSWVCWHTSLSGNTYIIELQSTNAERVPTYSVWTPQNNNSSVFGLGINTATNGSGSTHVAYCFAEVEGFSKFGKYSGNSSSDGPFIYCGFRPAFFMIKTTNTTGNWQVWDATRSPYNRMNLKLFPDLSNAEQSDASAYDIDFLSNGVKLRNYTSMSNYPGYTWIYMAFAENPFKYSTAR